MQVKSWQSDPLMDWLWESYQISSTLYQEIDAMGNRTIIDDYYKNHLSILEGRLEKAGVRLVGVLNQIFEGRPYDGSIIPPPAEALPPQKDTLVQDFMSIPAKECQEPCW